MRFTDRVDAGKRLAALLDAYTGEDVVVLALPRGGCPSPRRSHGPSTPRWT